MSNPVPAAPVTPPLTVNSATSLLLLLPRAGLLMAEVLVVLQPAVNPRNEAGVAASLRLAANRGLLARQFTVHLADESPSQAMARVEKVLRKANVIHIEHSTVALTDLFSDFSNDNTLAELLKERDAVRPLH